MMDNTRDVLECRDFDRVFASLQTVYDISLQKRKLCERLSQDCQDVLKPWPPKKVQGAPKPGEKDMSQVLAVNKEDLPPEDEQALILIEKALAKAEKLRDKFHTKANDSCSIKEKSKCQQTVVSYSKSASSKQTSGTLAKSSTCQIQQKGSESGKAIARNTISQSKLNKALEASRPGVLTQTVHGSAKSKYVPAHVKAPFKTEQQPKGQTLHIRVKSANSSKQKSTKSKDVKRVPVAVKTESQDVSQIGDVDANMKNKQCITNIDHRDSKERLPCVEQGKHIVDERLGNKKQTEEQTCRDGFCLQKQGKQLSLPSRYLHLQTKNQRLRKKIKSLNNSSPSSSVSCGVFMQRLQKSMDTDFSFGAVTLRKILSLTNAYHVLHTLLHQVPLTVAEHDNLAWSDILRYMHTVKLVLDGFVSLEKYYQELTRNRTKNALSDHPRLLKRPEVSFSTLYWIPKHMGSVSACRTCLKYTTRKQLVTYVTLLYEVQVLLLEKYILQEMKEALYKFHNATGKESWFVSTYRALYGMMCTFGRSFPTIVADTIDTDDDENSGGVDDTDRCSGDESSELFENQHDER